MKNTLRAVVASAAIAMTLGVASSASPAGAAPAGKTTICHGTSSDTNPQVIITISNNALKAHLGNTGIGHSGDPGPPGPKNPDEYADGGCGPG